MKRYVLSTLISLALASPLSFVDAYTTGETATPAPTATYDANGTTEPAASPAEAITQPMPPYGMDYNTPSGSPPAAAEYTIPPPPPAYDTEMMKKRFEHRREMEAQMQKIMETSDPVERRRLMEARMKEMQKHMEEMREVMGADMHGPARYMKVPPRHMKLPQQAGPMQHGWNYGYAQPPMPPYGRGFHYGPAPHMGPGMMPHHGPRRPANRQQMQQRLQHMEQRLGKVEKLLEKLVAAQEKKAAE